MEARNCPTPISADLEPDLRSPKRSRSRKASDRVDGAARKRLKLSPKPEKHGDIPRPPREPKDKYSRDGVMRGTLAPLSRRRKVGIVAQSGWSGWPAVATGLGWDIAFVAVGSGKLGDDWRLDLTDQGIPNIPYSKFSSALVEQSGIEILLLTSP
jgi:hypothetical protein